LYGWNNKHKFYGDGEQKTSVLDYDKPLKNDLHPTMKPVKLIVNALMNNSKKGDICLDIFLGSGSTLMASEQTGRKCYGIEIDSAYVDVIIIRYAAYMVKQNKKFVIKKNGKNITNDVLKWKGVK
jgi:DNA modification methylase